MGRVILAESFYWKELKDLKFRQSIEITLSKHSSFENFETDLETSHRQQDITVCRNDGENLEKK